jgi:hypothetical protein
MEYSGTITNPNSMYGKEDYGIIEFMIDDKYHKYDYHWISAYNYSVFDENKTIVIDSKSESNSIFLKLLGISGKLFFNQNKEILRITKFNKQVRYNNKVYEFKIEKKGFLWLFSTDEFHIEIKVGEGILNFKFKKDYLLQCLCCSGYLWSRYYHNFA